MTNGKVMMKSTLRKGSPLVSIVMAQASGANGKRVPSAREKLRKELCFFMRPDPFAGLRLNYLKSILL